MRVRQKYMNMQEPKKSRFEFLWPNIFTELGRKFVRNEGVLAVKALPRQD